MVGATARPLHPISAPVPPKHDKKAEGGVAGAPSQLLQRKWRQTSVLAPSVVHAVTPGVETSLRMMAAVGPVLLGIDRVILAVFVAGLLAP